MVVRPMVWVGVDAGKATHHAAAVDDAGRLCWSQKVPNDQAAVEELVARAAATAAEVRWAVDLTGSAAALLLAVLIAAGQQVAYVPGRTVNRMAAMFRGEGKTTPRTHG
jgi:transposase